MKHDYLVPWSLLKSYRSKLMRSKPSNKGYKLEMKARNKPLGLVLIGMTGLSIVSILILQVVNRSMGVF